jgi:hypothetical protein
MSKIKKEELAPEPEDSKALVIRQQGGAVVLPFEPQDDDFIAQEEEALIYPYVSIRQKDPREEVSYKTQRGWWKIANAPESTGDIEPPLKVVVLFWHKARTLFLEGDTTPHCKSIDGISGSLVTEETNMGMCNADFQNGPHCPYTEWKANGRPAWKGMDKPPCAEGRNLYCFSQQIGPCIVRLGRSSIKAWRAFDNLMAVKKIQHGGRLVRIPYHLTTIELETKKIVEGSFDPYWIVVPKFIGFIEDRDTLAIIRSLIPNKETYDKTARKVDLESEDINGRKVEDANANIEAEKAFADIFGDASQDNNKPEPQPTMPVNDDNLPF